MTVLQDMEMQRKWTGRSARSMDSRRPSIVHVGLPMPYEGVGNALRSTFAPAKDALPEDMLDLLSKLDRS
ncbi:hypothetical protein J3E64_002870 [Sphingobium sp. OAS761]|uniref:hypothetical protein n=1 Tax=Sphingobium sp. OAS761 TaxID=2817901 RepID=UPI0020A0730C|nr:hypothetical protein [Sphingobium sp. OAS761]MCP1471166.1 hypothetical protein [Sphingobium sp. OAS761]